MEKSLWGLFEHYQPRDFNRNVVSITYLAWWIKPAFGSVKQSENGVVFLKDKISQRYETVKIVVVSLTIK